MSEVIIVDDVFLGKAYSAELKSIGVTSTVLTNPELSVETIKNEGARLVLLDIMMIGKDGFEVLQDIQDDTKTKGIKVIVISRLKGDKDKSLAKNLGANEFLSKTEVSFSDVANKIKLLLIKA